MKSVKSTFYGHVRRTAYELWRGPDYVLTPDEDNPVGGLCILRLALRKGTSMKPLIESRAVYTSLTDDTQHGAILRAVYWDSQTVKRDSPPETTPIRIPAKFVQVPVERVRQWISAFDNLPTSLRVSRQQDDSLPICSLRIEIDPVDSVFEKVWRVIQNEDIELNHTWQDIWQEMNLALQTCPSITEMEEDFPCVKSQPDDVYDLQAYKPSLDLP